MNSRRVELWGEGFRFYDLKRLHMSIVHWHQMALKTPGSPKLEVLNLIRTFKVLA